MKLAGFWQRIAEPHRARTDSVGPAPLAASKDRDKVFPRLDALGDLALGGGCRAKLGVGRCCGRFAWCRSVLLAFGPGVEERGEVFSWWECAVAHEREDLGAVTGLVVEVVCLREPGV